MDFMKGRVEVHAQQAEMFSTAKSLQKPYERQCSRRRRYAVGGGGSLLVVYDDGGRACVSGASLRHAFLYSTKIAFVLASPLLQRPDRAFAPVDHVGQVFACTLKRIPGYQRHISARTLQ